jgi:hypothetical protein
MRPLFALLVARSAGTPLAPEEQDMLAQHDRQRELLRETVIQRIEQRGEMSAAEAGAYRSNGHDFQDYRAAVLKHFSTMSVEELQRTVLDQLRIMEIMDEGQSINTGTALRSRRARQHGGLTSAETRKRDRAEFVREIDALKAANPTEDDDALIEHYLRDCGTLELTRAKRKTQIKNARNRLKRGRNEVERSAH